MVWTQNIRTKKTHPWTPQKLLKKLVVKKKSPDPSLKLTTYN